MDDLTDKKFVFLLFCYNLVREFFLCVLLLLLGSRLLVYVLLCRLFRMRLCPFCIALCRSRLCCLYCILIGKFYLGGVCNCLSLCWHLISFLFRLCWFEHVHTILNLIINVLVIIFTIYIFIYN